jgi:riboflavin synthase
MFTGLIECVGQVADVKPSAAGFHLRVRTTLAPELRAGDSVAVNGVCLTATLAEHGEMHADIGAETLRVTTLASLQRDQLVNLERAMRADGRMGGHFVQGHVDGIGTVDRVREDGETRWITIRYPDALAPFVVPKGSIAVDGVSLTVAALGDSRIDLMIIPFTWAHTNLSSLRAGDPVNLECDMVGKYVARAVEIFGTGRLKPAPTS